MCERGSRQRSVLNDHRQETVCVECKGVGRKGTVHGKGKGQWIELTGSLNSSHIKNKGGGVIGREMEWIRSVS